MSKYIATVIDTSGIQKYIFGSNRLKENVAGSYLVKLATDDWVKKYLTEMGNVYIPECNPSQATPQINKNLEIIAELIYSGGGNTFLLFRDTEENYARKFTEGWSKKILFEAPGLNVEIAHQPFDWNQRLLQDLIENDLIKGKLDIQKRNLKPSVPLLGLGVTVSCISTGLVAVKTRKIDGQTRPISREVVKKLAQVDNANDELRKILFDDRKPRKRKEQYDIPLDVDDLGRSENESSYMAVVHIDGNRMGKRFEDYGKAQSNSQNSIADKNRDFIMAMRKLSWEISEASRKALEAVGYAVIKVVDEEKFEIKENYLPFRPIVYGGDDVTFVCDGRLGLSLAVKFLEKFEEFTQDLPDKKGKVTACAGIAIIKTHYPFSRAYALSESLCSQAKQWMKKETNDYEKPLFSALDWHIAASGLLGGIGEIREREYRVQIPDLDRPASLTMRPMRSHSCPNQWRTWGGFSQVVNDFLTHKDWKDRRNKVMALREILRQGKKATEKFLQAYSLETLPAFPEANSVLSKEGWYTDICGYFDAIEAMDFYTPLEE
jgi:CRISPR/Cas system-associated protein Cas10 (large subunit of type III CRISPR-Cas system)